MAQNWNLQDIKPIAPRKKRRQQIYENQMNSDSNETISESDGTLRIKIENGKKKRTRGFMIGFTIFALIIIFIFGASYLLRGAEITVIPRQHQPNINAVFTAFKTPEAGDLAYEIMTLEASGERQVKASGQEKVTTQATGEIEIIKTTPGTQRLITNTRFETQDGLIFKISDSVIVPGAVKTESGELSPGRIRAQVFSDGYGENYNIDPTKFTIPGLKSDAELFNSIYAESKEKFKGGFDGERFIIDETELETAKQALQTELRDALLGRIDSEKPAGFVVFDDAVTFTYESLPSVKYGDDLATIKETAFLKIPIFKEQEFASFLAKLSVPGYEDEPVRVDNYQELQFSYTTTNPPIASTDISQYESISFEIVGKPKIVWIFDSEKLKADLFGVNKTAFENIVKSYPAIENATATIRPFWSNKFPTSFDEIKIIEILK